MDDLSKEILEMQQSYTVEQVAALFHVHKETVRVWVRQERIKAMRLPGGGIRISLSEIARILGKTELAEQ